MAVIVDLICTKCKAKYIDRMSDAEGTKCAKTKCSGKLERLWTMTQGIAPGIHPSEQCVVYVSQKEGGKVQYPGRNDIPVPDRLARRGYEKMVMGPRELRGFEKKYGVANERMHMDKGNGRGLENS